MMSKTDFNNILIIIFLATIGCKDALDEKTRVQNAAEFIHLHEVPLIGINAPAGWVSAKATLGYSSSKINIIRYIEIAEDHSITLYNVTHDCEYEGDRGSRAVQTSATLFLDLNFGDITEFAEIEDEIDEKTVYKLLVSFNQEFLIQTDWMDCENIDIPSLIFSNLITEIVIITFENQMDLREYRSQLEILKEANY